MRFSKLLLVNTVWTHYGLRLHVQIIQIARLAITALVVGHESLLGAGKCTALFGPSSAVTKLRLNISVVFKRLVIQVLLWEMVVEFLRSVSD